MFLSECSKSTSIQENNEVPMFGRSVVCLRSVLVRLPLVCLRVSFRRLRVCVCSEVLFVVAVVVVAIATV